jgi:hypothetical protein
MRSLVGLLSAVLITIFLGIFTWIHMKQSAESVELQAGTVTHQVTTVAKQARNADDTYTLRDEQDSETIAGPLASFMKGFRKVEVVEAKYKPTASDYVGDSVVGTTNKVLHQNFVVAGIADVPFEVPAHAYSPQMHGTFRSFVQAGSAPTTSPGDVDFLLLSDQQYSALMTGHPSDAVFAADETHDQEVNANLPPTLNQAIKYHLIFRNVSPKTGKKVVQAEFEMNF